MRACLCGVSGWGKVHYDDLVREAEAGRCRIVAATVINQDEEADKCRRLRELGCALYDDYFAMLAAVGDGADVCWLPVGIALHAPFSIAAMRAGMNVFVEKPLAATIQDAHRLMEVEKETGRWLAVGYQDMYQPDTRRMKRLMLDGRLGEVRMIKCGGCWPRERAYYDRNAWAGQLKHGDHWVLDSPFNNALAHQLNQLCFLAGASMDAACNPASIRAELYRANDITSADTACLRIETAEGTPLMFVATHACSQTHHPDIIIRGSRGTLTWTMRSALTLELADGTREDLGVEPTENHRRNIFDALLARLDDPAARICTVRQAAAQTLCVNGAHAGTPVRPIPSDYLRTEPRNDSIVTAVDGMERLVARSIDEEAMFSDLGVPWATQARPFDLRGFTRFTGPASA